MKSIAVAVVLALCLASVADAQFGRRGGRNGRFPPNGEFPAPFRRLD